MVVLLFVGFFGLLVGTLGMLFLWNSWNRLVSLELNVLDAWADYESEVQKKYEMLPSLHNIVKGYAAHELKFFEQLFVARQAASGALLAQRDFKLV